MNIYITYIYSLMKIFGHAYVYSHDPTHDCYVGSKLWSCEQTPRPFELIRSVGQQGISEIQGFPNPTSSTQCLSYSYFHVKSKQLSSWKVRIL